MRDIDPHVMHAFEGICMLSVDIDSLCLPIQLRDAIETKLMELKILISSWMLQTQITQTDTIMCKYTVFPRNRNITCHFNVHIVPTSPIVYAHGFCPTDSSPYHVQFGDSNYILCHIASVNLDDEKIKQASWRDLSDVMAT